jgi:hypothetical protein
MTVWCTPSEIYASLGETPQNRGRVQSTEILQHIVREGEGSKKKVLTDGRSPEPVEFAQ